MEEDGRKPCVSNEESERQSLRKECPMDVTNVKPDALNEASKGHPCPLGQLLRPFPDTDGVRSGDTQTLGCTMCPRCPIGVGCLQDVGFPDTDGVRSGRAPWLHGRDASLGVLSFRWIGHSFGFYGLFLLHNLFG